MGNVFDGYPNCKGAFRFEAGAFADDELGVITLGGSDPPTIDSSTYIEGAASAFFDYTDYGEFVLADATAPADFPLKESSGETTFSVTLWVRMTDHVDHTYELFAKGGIGAQCEIGLFVTSYAGWGLGVRVNAEFFQQIGIELVADRWYHIGFTYNGADDVMTMRVWDDTAQAIHGTWTDTATAPPGDSSVDWNIGGDSSDANYYIDEVAFFNDVLTGDEIDEIRAGTLGQGGGGATGQAALDAYTAMNLGCPF